MNVLMMPGAAPRIEATVRPARPEDAETIRALMRTVIEAAVEPPLRSAILENVEANVAVWLRRPSECVHRVAVLDGAIVGVVLVKDFWNLCSLFVAPASQRAGIGKALVAASIAACEGRSPRNGLRLNAYPDAVAFYERLGFMPSVSTQDLPSGVRPMELAFARHET